MSVDCSGDPIDTNLSGPFTFRNLSTFGIVPGSTCSVNGCFNTDRYITAHTTRTSCLYLAGKHKIISGLGLFSFIMGGGKKRALQESHHSILRFSYL